MKERLVPSLALGALALLASCATTSHERSTTMTENLTTVRKIYDECLNEGRLELLDTLIGPGYVGPTGETGPAAARKTFAGLRTAFPDIHYTLDELYAAGDQVLVRWTWEGTHTGPFRQFAPTGKHFVNTGMASYRVKHGRVESIAMETDRLGFLQQLGVVADDQTLGVAPRPPR